VYNKPNGCSATGALALGPDHQQQQGTSNKGKKQTLTYVGKISLLCEWLKTTQTKKTTTTRHEMSLLFLYK
jgi:hypothetical protein